MGPISSGLGEIYQFEVRGEPMCEGEDTPDCYTPMELRTILDWYIAYQLRSVPGVVEVNSFGGELKTYEVRPDPDRLRALGLGLTDLFEALRRNNVSAGGGYIAHAGEQRLMRGEGLVGSLDDIRRVVVTTRDGGTPIRVGDVAEVVHAPMIRQGAVTRDGRGEVVTGIVMMLIGANSGQVARDVHARHRGAATDAARRRDHRDLLRPNRAGQPHHPHRAHEPDRGRRAGRRRALALARQRPRRAAGGERDPAQHAGRASSPWTRSACPET